tara:strand:- start:681 stop:1001 length:321 start_codon:yes stop_codon:yes gene_type:complete
MSKIGPTLKPVNRYLTIVPHLQKNETNSGVLVPEDFELKEERFVCATVIDVAPDCSSAIQKLRGHSSPKQIIVDRSMIEEVKLKEKVYHIILENYVLGILRGFNEI